MKTILCFAFIVLAFVAKGATIEEQLPDLLVLCDNDDFDVREKAVTQLAQYPAEYVDKFLKMADDEKNPEVQYRLRMAARGIFDRRVGNKDDRWLLFHGTLCLSGELLWVTKEDWNADFPYYHRECSVLGLLVSYVDDLYGPCKDKIKQLDIITSIDGSGINPINVKAGSDYVVHIRRYKDLKYLEEHNSINPDATDKDFDELTVTVTAAWQERRFLNENAEADLMDKLWFEYLDRRKLALQK